MKINFIKYNLQTRDNISNFKGNKIVIKKDLMYVLDDGSSIWDKYCQFIATRISPNLLSIKKAQARLQKSFIYDKITGQEKNDILKFLESHYKCGNLIFDSKIFDIASEKFYDKNGNSSLKNFKSIYNITKAAFDKLDEKYRISESSNPYQRYISVMDAEQTKPGFNPENKLLPDISYLYEHAGLRDKNGIFIDSEVNHLIDEINDGYAGLKVSLIAVTDSNNSIDWKALKILKMVACEIKKQLIPEKNFEHNFESDVNSLLSLIYKSVKDNNGVVNYSDLSSLKDIILDELNTNGLYFSANLQNSIPDTFFNNIFAKISSEYLYKFKINFDNSDDSNVMNFINKKNLRDNELISFLYSLTSDKICSKIIAKEFSNNPREADGLYNELLEKLGGDNKAKTLLDLWINDRNKGYCKAYARYFREDILDKAEKLEDVVKESPLIAPWVLESLNSKKNIPLSLGELPEEFGSEKDFAKLIRELRIFNRISDKKNNKYEIIDDNTYLFKINKKGVIVKPLSKGLSAKIKFVIIPESNKNQRYIVKLAPDNSKIKSYRDKMIKENTDLRPDSTYSNAMYDFYLKLNDSKNAADIKYYNYKNNVVLYGVTNGKTPELNTFNHTSMIRNYYKISDLKALGFYVNDTNKDNFIISDIDNQYKLIDSGHADFHTHFRPLIEGVHAKIGNLCGRD